ncbi:MAG: hypothetical protein J5896_05760 [Alphaproteobacteria bacterium]|nr:hypothetical protein [Alphaproteobacteria bacterium]
MGDSLNKALDNLQAQKNEKAKADAIHKAEKKAKHLKEQEMKKRFPQAVKENQIDEVKALIEANANRTDIYYHKIFCPSIEMAEILLDDMHSVLPHDDSYYGYDSCSKNMICDCIEDHPEDVQKWDKFAKEHRISYDLKIRDREVFDKLIEQGFDAQCFDFDELVKNYYMYKNGCVGLREIGWDRCVPVWENQEPDVAKEIKEDLIYVLSRGYKINLSDKDSESYMFVQELLKEKELQKKGVDKSYTYRAPEEEFYDKFSGECNLSIPNLSLIAGNHFSDIPSGGNAKGIIKNGFTGQINYGNGGKIQYKNNKRHGVSEIKKRVGEWTWEWESKYYENGIDVTKKHEALKRIASKRINKEKAKEEKTGKSVILKKMHKLKKVVEVGKERVKSH